MKPIMALTALLFLGVVFLVGCGDDGSTRVSISRPLITQVSPQDGDTDVNLNPLIEVWFSEAMNRASLDSIRVKGVASSYAEYDDTLCKASLHLAELLDPETVYELRIHSAVMSERGSNIEGDSIVSFTTGPLDCEHTRDHLEPNDDLPSAVDIEIDKLYPVLTLCLGDERNDYYRFSLEHAAMVRFRSIAHAGMPTTYWSTALIRPPGQVYVSLSDSLRGGGEYAPHYSCMAGEYVVHVYKGTEGADIAVYDFILATSAPCPDDQYEDNDFNDQAVPVTEGLIEGLRGCFKDRDYFKTDLTTGQTLTLTVTQTTAEDVWGGIYLFGPSGRLDDDHAKGRPLEVSHTATEDATYWWNVTWDGDGIEYNLNVEVMD